MIDSKSGSSFLHAMARWFFLPESPATRRFRMPCFSISQAAMATLMTVASALPKETS
ncbi:MAG: hypothetical protein BWY66_01702 [bacterium ADurb.Bin374]|nr:MAG: hypothetical protein BWY66_01702 [bacterium ADurb.Bin374]